MLCILHACLCSSVCFCSSVKRPYLNKTYNKHESMSSFSVKSQTRMRMLAMRWMAGQSHRWPLTQAQVLVASLAMGAGGLTQCITSLLPSLRHTQLAIQATGCRPQAHPTAESCVLLCTVSEDAHASQPGTMLGDDAYAAYAAALREARCPRRPMCPTPHGSVLRF